MRWVRMISGADRFCEIFSATEEGDHDLIADGATSSISYRQRLGLIVSAIGFVEINCFNHLSTGEEDRTGSG